MFFIYFLFKKINSYSKIVFIQPLSHFASLLWTTDISALVWQTKTSRVRLWVKGGTEIEKLLVAVLYFLIHFNSFSNLVRLFVLVSGVPSRFVCFCWMFYCFKMFRFYYFTFSLVKYYCTARWRKIRTSISMKTLNFLEMDSQSCRHPRPQEACASKQLQPCPFSQLLLYMCREATLSVDAFQKDLL